MNNVRYFTKLFPALIFSIIISFFYTSLSNAGIISQIFGDTKPKLDITIDVLNQNTVTPDANGQFPITLKVRNGFFSGTEEIWYKAHFPGIPEFDGGWVRVPDSIIHRNSDQSSAVVDVPRMYQRWEITMGVRFPTPNAEGDI